MRGGGGCSVGCVYEGSVGWVYEGSVGCVCTRGV